MAQYCRESLLLCCWNFSPIYCCLWNAKVHSTCFCSAVIDPRRTTQFLLSFIRLLLLRMCIYFRCCFSSGSVLISFDAVSEMKHRTLCLPNRRKMQRWISNGGFLLEILTSEKTKENSSQVDPKPYWFTIYNAQEEKTEKSEQFMWPYCECKHRKARACLTIHFKVISSGGEIFTRVSWRKRVAKKFFRKTSLFMFARGWCKTEKTKNRRIFMAHRRVFLNFFEYLSR